MAKKQVCILGAGLSGLSIAWHLQKKGIDCVVFEQEPEAGGLCRSKNINGFCFDYSGHLLHFKSRYAFNLVKSLLGNNLSEQKRSAWINFNRQYIPYPFQANLYSLPSKIKNECLYGLLQAYKNGFKKKRRNANFQDWINFTFGKGIAKHFFFPYNTKFWTVSPRHMNCDLSDSFIPVPSYRQMKIGAVGKSKVNFGYNAKFWYPKRGGIGSLSRSLASGIKNIHTGRKLTAIDLKRKEIRLSGGIREKFEYLISTIPLPETPMFINDMPDDILSRFSRLKWNSIFNLNLGIERPDGSGRHWIYFPGKDTDFFRVGFYHNFNSTAAPKGKSSLYVEVSYSKTKPIEKGKVVPEIINDLLGIGLISREDVVLAQDVNDIAYGYPIYDSKYSDSRQGIIKYLNRFNVIPCGRYGSWRYMSMEDVILEGRSLAESLF